MSIVSIRLPDDLLAEVDKFAKELKMPRTEYIRRAVESLNKEHLSTRQRERLISASRRTRQESRRINAEFNQVEDDPKT